MSVHCFDIAPEPSSCFHSAQKRIEASGEGSIKYHQVNVSDAETLETLVGQIADKHQRLDGLIAGTQIHPTLITPHPNLTHPPQPQESNK